MLALNSWELPQGLLPQSWGYNTLATTAFDAVPVCTRRPATRASCTQRKQTPPSSACNLALLLLMQDLMNGAPSILADTVNGLRIRVVRPTPSSPGEGCSNT